MKKLIELSIKGVSAALVCFSLFGIVWNLVNGGDYILTDYVYTKMVLGAVVVGLGFSIPGIVYESPNLPYIMKIGSYGNRLRHLFGYILCGRMDSRIFWYQGLLLQPLQRKLRCPFSCGWIFSVLQKAGSENK